MLWWQVAAGQRTEHVVLKRSERKSQRVGEAVSTPNVVSNMFIIARRNPYSNSHFSVCQNMSRSVFNLKTVMKSV